MNSESDIAWQFVEHTGTSIFLTGKAGTGKTTFLRNVVERSAKRSIVVAPTGVAAINAGGVTIHSFFQLPPSPYVPETHVRNKFDFSKEKRKIIRTLDMLIIDEISMVRSDLLDAIDSVLRRYREHDKPFGGVQLLMIGDLQQLTPVVTPSDEMLLKPYYDTPYFFGSHALQSIPYVTIELTHVYRQQNEAFVSILNHIREARVDAADLARLNERCLPSFRPRPEEDYVRLTTHNRLADDYNASELLRLPNESYKFHAEIDGTFPEYSYPADKTLTLKVGAQVMFVKNDSSGRHLYYNGRIGHVVGLSSHGIRVLCPGDTEPIDVPLETWQNARYTLNATTKEIEAKVDGTFKQYPLRLAWAITIHKSQGLTFDHAIIDANASFAPGQVYVALSRCRTLEGMVLASPITGSNVFGDQRVDDYIMRQHAAAEQSIGSLQALKDEYYRQQLLELFSLRELQQLEDTLMRVMIDHFYKFPKVVDLHKNAYQKLTSEVGGVAQRWAQIICSMTIVALHEEEFLDRVARGAAYFKNELHGLFEPLLDHTKMVKTDNKAAMKRLDTAFTDLSQSYLTRIRLLGSIVDHGFTISNYLHFKQMAFLEAVDDGTGAKRKTREKKPPKPKREPTRELTLRLYEGGMSPEAIAETRGLTKTTIMGHLAHYIESGRIDSSSLLSEARRAQLRKVIGMAGVANGKAAIKSLCPPEVTFSDIDVAIAEMRRDGLLR